MDFIRSVVVNVMKSIIDNIQEIESLESGQYTIEPRTNRLSRASTISVILNLDVAPSATQNYETNQVVYTVRNQVFQTLILQSAPGANSKVYARVELNDKPFFPEIIEGASNWIAAVGTVLKIEGIALITKEHDKLNFMAYSTDQIDTHEISFILI